MNIYSEEIKQAYGQWLENATEDPDIIRELKDMEADPEAVKDAFYRDLPLAQEA